MTAMIAAALAGLAAWLSIGTLGMTAAPGGELVRLGLLPPIWLLPVLMAIGAAAARVSRLSSRAASPLFSSLLLVLPWIPGHVPAAFLIWTGRVAMGLWVAIAIAMLASAERPAIFGSALQSWMSDPRRAPRVAAAVACALYIASAWWLGNILPGGDEPHYLIITQSLLKDHDLQIENNHARRDYAEYFPGDLSAPHYLRRGTNGQIYSIHAPGLSVVVAPAFAFGGYHAVVVFLSLLAALGGALMWLTAYRLTESAGSAWFAWAAWALTVPFFFQAFCVYPDGIGATIVLFAAQPLLGKGGKRDRESFSTGSAQKDSRSPFPLFLTGTALAMLPWLHTRFAIIAVALGGCILLRLLASTEGRSRIPVFLAVPVVSAIAWFAFFRVIWGTFSPAVPYNGYTLTSASNILNGLPALLFDQQFGILPYAPVYGFCLVGLAMLARTRPRLAAELSVTAVLYLLSSSAYYMWWGGSSAPARFAVPVLPLLILPGAWIWKSARHSGTRAIGLALLLVSVAITAITVAVDGGQLAYNFRDGYSRVAEWISPLVDLPQALPSFFRQTSGAAVFRALIWAGSIALVWLALKQTPAKRMLAAVILPALAIAVMLSTTIVWKLQDVAGPTPDTSGLSLLEHADARLRPIGVDLSRAGIGPWDALVARISISTPRRRPAPPPGTLLLVPGVLPAGTYALVFGKSANPAGAAGTARLVIGRNAKPAAAWNLATDLRDGAVQFHLPVDVGSIVIQGDEDAIRSAGSLSLRAIELVPGPQRLIGGYARRVEPYGTALAYFFGDDAYVEQPGFWVRGGAEARVAVMTLQPGAGLQLFVRNAPVDNRVRVSIDGQAQVLELKPRAERFVPIPSATGRRASLVEIYSQAGFRPSQVDPGSADTRYLGVWIELRP